MNPRPKKVIPLEDYVLQITFTNDETKLFDVKPYLNEGIFKELQNKSYFQTVSVSGISIVWPNEQDFCPDTLYEDSFVSE